MTIVVGNFVKPEPTTTTTTSSPTTTTTTPMKIAVIRGGRSSEHEISLESGASVAAGAARRRPRGGRGPDRSRRALDAPTASEVELRAAGGLLGVDVAFPVLHGPFGEDGTVQGLLEVLDVPYAGPAVLAAAVAMDKLICKRLLAFGGRPAGRVLRGRRAGLARARGGDAEAALGEAVAARLERRHLAGREPRGELDAAIEGAAAHDPRVIIEANAGGREVECSVIGNAGLGADDDGIETSLPGAIVTRASDWYDYEAKYAEGGMELVVPAPIGDEAIARVRELAAQVFRAIGGTGLARCDFFVTDDGEVLVNEINTIPGFTATSVFGKLFEASGVTYPELCDRLVELARRAPPARALVSVLALVREGFELLGLVTASSTTRRAPWAIRPAHLKGDFLPACLETLKTP